MKIIKIFAPYLILSFEISSPLYYLIPPGSNLPAEGNLLLERVKLKGIHLADDLTEDLIACEAVKVQHHKVDNQILQATGSDAQKGELLIVHRADGLPEDAGLSLNS